MPCDRPVQPMPQNRSLRAGLKKKLSDFSKL
jgi:hypothetical protein